MEFSIKFIKRMFTLLIKDVLALAFLLTSVCHHANFVVKIHAIKIHIKLY